MSLRSSSSRETLTSAAASRADPRGASSSSSCGVAGRWQLPCGNECAGVEVWTHPRPNQLHLAQEDVGTRRADTGEALQLLARAVGVVPTPHAEVAQVAVEQPF